MTGYANPLEYLLDELRRIDLTLFYHVQKSRIERRNQAQDEFRGLYISEEEIDDLFSRSGAAKHDPTVESLLQDLQRTESAIATKVEGIERRKAESGKSGMVFSLDRLCGVFGLDSFDREVLLFAIAPELNLKYDKIYAYLQDNVTKKRPTVDLLLSTLCQSFDEKVRKRSRFCQSSPLVAHNILELFDEPGMPRSSFMAKCVKVDEGIVGFLMDEDVVDAQMKPFVELMQPRGELELLHLEPSTRELLFSLGETVSDRVGEDASGLLIHFNGPRGVGKKSAAEAICNQAGLSMLTVDMRGFVASDNDPSSSVDRILRLARLKDAAVFCSETDYLFSRGERSDECKRIFFGCAAAFKGILILSTLPQGGDGILFEGLPTIQVGFSLPSYELRKRLWQMHLEDQGTGLEPADLSALASRFRLAGGQIREIVSSARVNSLAGEAGAPIPVDALFNACRVHSRHRLINLAVKVSLRRSWNDIVLPKDRTDVLREICNYVKHQATVLDDWGFGKKLALSKGLNILFAGPSGTGKSMAAEVIGDELGLDLYRIDLATVVSKYIGETEKNLDRIFREAEHSNAILFFDEADAIFGKRSEIHDSHDRYANIEISYLLQKMESYDGIAILATNLRKNLDEAFLRRMHFTLEYPMPEEADRLKIWQLCFPSEAPLQDEVDLRFMARQFKISGGNIKNIAVASAFHAAENGGEITMASLVHATKREFQKIGKLVVESDFSEFMHLLDPGRPA